MNMTSQPEHKTDKLGLYDSASYFFSWRHQLLINPYSQLVLGLAYSPRKKFIRLLNLNVRTWRTTILGFKMANFALTVVLVIVVCLQLPTGDGSPVSALSDSLYADVLKWSSTLDRPTFVYQGFSVDMSCIPDGSSVDDISAYRFVWLDSSRQPVRLQNPTTLMADNNNNNNSNGCFRRSIDF